MIRPLKVLLLLLFLSGYAHAQSWEIGGSVGGMGYMGDLNQVKFYKVTDLAFGGMAKRNIDGYWAIKFGFLQGNVRADDAKSSYQQERQRNLRFFSPLTEGSIMVEFNLFNYGLNFSQKRISPFLFTGLAAFSFQPKAKSVVDGNIYNLRLYGTEGQTAETSYKTVTLSIPFGAGVKFRLSDYWNLSTELGYRKASTDYLDDVSQVYVNPASLTGASANETALRRGFADPSISTPSIPKVGVPGTQRGDFRKNDTYLFLGITLSYTFVTQKCYSF